MDIYMWLGSAYDYYCLCGFAGSAGNGGGGGGGGSWDVGISFSEWLMAMFKMIQGG